MSGKPGLEPMPASIAEYEGMKVVEYVFARMENYSGETLDYILDLVTSPEETGALRPVVIFVHGGGFMQPWNRRQPYIPVFARRLTAAGYAVVSPDYPLFDNPEQRAALSGCDLGADRAAEAVHRAYRFVQENAQELGLDPDRVAIMGGSAGGMAGFYLLEHYPDRFRMFVNCWGAPQNYTPDVHGFPPTLSIHGTADQAVPYALEAAIQEGLEASGVDHELITLEGAQHTPMGHFDGFIPTVLTWLEKYMQ